MPTLCRQIAESEVFQTFILILIVFNALVMGFETVPAANAFYEDEFFLVFAISQVVFVIEILIRLIAYAPRFLRFFDSFWNTFDFTIVALSLVPMVGPFTLAARLLRVVRALRILSVSDKLRGFIEHFHVSLEIMIRMTLVLAILVYVFAVSGFYLFNEINPAHWGDLGSAALALCYLMLFNEIREVFQGLAAAPFAAAIYFLAFYGAYLSLLFNTLAAITAEHLRKED